MSKVEDVAVINAQAQVILEEILNDPNRKVYQLWDGSLKIYSVNGRGAAFKKDGSFRGFIEKHKGKQSDSFKWSRVFVRRRDSEQKQKFWIELCSDLDFEGMVVDVSYNMQTVASINYDKGVEKMEVEMFPFGNDSQKTILPLQEFLDVLEKAKQLAIRCSKEDEAQEKK